MISVPLYPSVTQQITLLTKARWKIDNLQQVWFKLLDFTELSPV